MKGRAGQKPGWYKGKMVRCDRCGFWYGEDEGKLFEQEGLMVDKACFDKVTDRQREEQLNRR